MSLTFSWVGKAEEGGSEPEDLPETVFVAFGTKSKRECRYLRDLSLSCFY
jgi:hypothetical protein